MMPKKLIASPELLAERIQAFCDAVEAGDIPAPTDYELCRWLGVSAGTLERMWADTGAYKGFADVLKSLVAFRSHWCMMRGDTWAIFAAKQPHWGGWRDRPAEEKAPIKIDVSLSGAGADWAK